MAKSKRSKPTEPARKSPSPEAKEPSPPANEKLKSEDSVGSSEDKEQRTAPVEETFESYYLKRVTAEFADDIDKIRNAPDFIERSVPVLIQALKQGANTFSEEDKKIILGAGK